jgi:hypothetical protein
MAHPQHLNVEPWTYHHHDGGAGAAVPLLHLQSSLNEEKQLMAHQQQPDLGADSYGPMPMVGAMMAPPLPTAVPPLPGMPLLPLGVSGLPHARPRFDSAAEDGIRHPKSSCCLKYNPGDRIPPHWYEGGKGWVTKYFYDAVQRNPATKNPGAFRCQVRRPDGHLCNEQVAPEKVSSGGCCEDIDPPVPDKMVKHLTSVHGLTPPPRRKWATDLFETQGCCDALFCIPCNGARQMMALSGWEDTMHWGWCLFFTFWSFENIGVCEDLWMYIPPWIYVAILTRFRMIKLNNIDEHVCETLGIVAFCAPCSVAQTYRELTASGVWAGSICTERFENYGTIGAPKPTLQQIML